MRNLKSASEYHSVLEKNDFGQRVAALVAVEDLVIRKIAWNGNEEYKAKAVACGHDWGKRQQLITELIEAME